MDPESLSGIPADVWLPPDSHLVGVPRKANEWQSRPENHPKNRPAAHLPPPKTFQQMDRVSYRYGNVFQRNFSAVRPNQKWVTDVTYIRTVQGWAYLAVIKDLFDGFIIAHRLGMQNSVGLVTRMLEDAKAKEQVPEGLILHSDQGFQYSSSRYQCLTRDYRITPSMSRRGNCWDNAPAESFFSQLKEEEVRHWKNPSYQQARMWIDDYIHFYNHERIQLKTGRTPFQLRCPS